MAKPMTLERRLLGTLLTIGAFAVLPIVITLLAGLIAGALGCHVDEGGPHTCLVLGHDIGGALSIMGMTFWFAFITVPIGAVAIIVVPIVATLGAAWQARPQKRIPPNHLQPRRKGADFFRDADAVPPKAQD